MYYARRSQSASSDCNHLPCPKFSVEFGSRSLYLLPSMSYVIQDIQIQSTHDWNNLSSLFMLPRGASAGRNQITCTTLLQSHVLKNSATSKPRSDTTSPPPPHCNSAIIRPSAGHASYPPWCPTSSNQSSQRRARSVARLGGDHFCRLPNTFPSMLCICRCIVSRSHVSCHAAVAQHSKVFLHHDWQYLAFPRSWRGISSCLLCEVRRAAGRWSC